MRSIIKLVLVVVALLVGYNYFYGTSEERSESQEIVGKVKDLGKSIGGLLKSEKDKFDDGKFDNLFDNLGNLFNKIEDKIDKADNTSKDVLENLKKEKSDLEEKWKNKDKITEGESNEFKSEMEDLYSKMEDLLQDLDKK